MLRSIGLQDLQQRPLIICSSGRFFMWVPLALQTVGLGKAVLPTKADSFLCHDIIVYDTVGHDCMLMN